MKDKRMSKTMRWTAGVIYGVLALFEVLALRYVLANASISQIPVAWVFEIILLLGASVMAVWMLGGNAVVKPSARRAVVVATALVVLFELLTYKAQTDAILYSLGEWFPSMMQGGGSLYLLIAMIVRLLLLILAAFFVQSASAEMDMLKAGDDLEDALNEVDNAAKAVEDAVENGLDEETAENVLAEVEKAENDLTDAVAEMGTALEEAAEEDGARVVVVGSDKE